MSSSAHAQTNAPTPVSVRTPAQTSERTPGRTGEQQRLLRLQCSAGNQAVTRLVAQRKLSDEETKRAQALEALLKPVSAAASSRATAIASSSDTCVTALKDATANLTKVAENYRQGFDQFTKILQKADAEEEGRWAADLVQGLVIGMLATFLLPEVLAGGAVIAAAKAADAAMRAKLIQVGVTAANSVAKDLIEAGVGKGASSTGSGGDMPKPTSTTEAGGASAADKFAEVLAKINGMVAALPALGALSNGQAILARGADGVALTAAQLRAGDSLPDTIGSLEAKVKAIQETNAQAPAVMQNISQLQARMIVLKEQAMSVKPEEPNAYELKLWNNWIPSLLGKKNELLDNDVIQDYLGPKGKNLIADYTYMSDNDQAKEVLKAQRRWLDERGIPVGSEGAVPQVYNAHSTKERVQAQVQGKTGTIVSSAPGTGRGRIEVAGKRLAYSGNAGVLKPGTQVIVSIVVFSSNLKGNELIADWESNLEVLTLAPAADTAVDLANATGGTSIGP